MLKQIEKLLLSRLQHGVVLSLARAALVVWCASACSCVREAGSVLCARSVGGVGVASLSCTRHTGCPGGVDVVGCFHAGGHVGDIDGRAVMANLMATHRRVRPWCWGAGPLSDCWGVRRYWGTSI